MRRVRIPPRPAPRPRDANKATVGRVLVVGGSRGMAGAPALAALGALRAGAGLVRIATSLSAQPVAASFRPEVLTAGLAETRDGALAAAAAAGIAALARSADAVVLGPGAGRAASTVALLRTLPSTIEAPLVLDADGLFAWAGRAQGLATRKAPTVLTPHEGEAGRLLGLDAAAVRGDREGAAVRLANLAGAVVVLKGPGTLVTDGSRSFRCSTGGPSLATGGTGDVLAGIVAAFLAAPKPPGGDAFGAACAAVHLHGLAGDRAAGASDRGVLASEVADAVPRELATWLRGKRRR